MTAFRDRVVLITGAGSGIGRHLAGAFLREGARIAALDRGESSLATLASELGGDRLACATADVTDLAAVRTAVRGLEARLGPVDVLVASAGIGRPTPAAEFSAEEINAHIQINLIGVVNALDAVLPGMRQRGQGHLVVLSSLASYRGLPYMAGYCASKAGVNALFDSLRLELVPRGIAVTTLCPGWIQTPMTAPLNLPPGAAMSLDWAGQVILQAIRRRQPYIAFPPRMAWRLRLLRYLPRPVSDWLARRHLRRAVQLPQRA